MIPKKSSSKNFVSALRPIKDEYQSLTLHKKLRKDQKHKCQSLPKQINKTIKDDEKSTIIYNNETFNFKISNKKNKTTKMESQYQYVRQVTEQFMKHSEKGQLVYIKKRINKNEQQIQSENVEQFNPRKIEVLKHLLDNFNSNKLQKKFYQKLVNTFGLRIKSVKYQKKQQITKSKSRNPTKQTISAEPEYKSTIVQRKLLNKKGLEQQLNEKMNETKRLRQQILRRPSTTQKIQKQLQKQKPFRYSIDKDSFQSRLMKYQEFLFLINMSNGIYRNLQIYQYQPSLKYFIGKGNNSNLIQSIMKKRFWFVRTNNIKQAHFIWTQIKVEDIYQNQPKNIIEYPQNASIKQFEHKNSVDYTIDNNKINLHKRGSARLYQPKNPYLKILSDQEYSLYTLYFKRNHRFRNLENLISYLKNVNKKIKISMPVQNEKLHNHLPENGLLGNKKAMYYCLKQYHKLINKNVFSILPLTFHIQNGTKDTQFKKFVTYYNQNKKLNKKNIWIIKPGQFTNRGNGISCSNKIQQIKKKITSHSKQSTQNHTFIIQQYITRPLLYHRRKFDIRAYILITINNGILKGYWYQQGYIRTSSSLFDLDELSDPTIHLTNDAVQKNYEEYGKYQQGNKLTYNQLQRYLQSINCKLNFYNTVYQQMRRIARDAIRSTALFLDPLKRGNNFEIYGLDFMIDQNFKVWLIQINTNPCLELSCGILQRLIPHMVQNAFRISVDPVFPPQNNFSHAQKYNVSQNALYYNKFELVFDEIGDGQYLEQLYKNSKIIQQIGKITQDKQQYQNDGNIIELND